MRPFHTAVAMVALATSACTSRPYKTPVIEAMAPAAPRFAGLRELSPGKPIKVLVVHGMCTHDFNWVLGWTGAMARSFGSPAVPRPSEPVGGVQTARFDFRDGDRVVEVTFALWSPMTWQAKATLAFDSPPGFKFKRAKFNAAAKSLLINDCFSDPVIYSGSRAPGTIGAAIRTDMAEVVCRFIGGTWAEEKCSGAEAGADRAFITESLGSKVLVDAVERVVESGGGTNGPARAALADTRAVFMLANQLPLLRLAELKTGATQRIPGQGELRLFGPRDATGAADARSELQLVAFTDPNDQFGYRLTYDSIGERPDRVALFNVIVSNTATYFGLAANPWPAHVGYWDNPRIPALVLEGGQAGR